MSILTFSVCSYNRARRLSKLITLMRKQRCPVDYEILIVDNNSEDNTRQTVQQAARKDGPPVRYVFEPEQGISYARNRAIQESLNSDFLVFIDDDELPHPCLLQSAVDALQHEGAACAGGRIRVVCNSFKPRPWLDDGFRKFLGEIDYGDHSFWITDRSTPVWSGNVAYRTNIFKEDAGLRFDVRYNRRGNQMGGGEDAVMFWSLLDRGFRIRYRPDMVVEHHVESWRLRRRYFLKLHFVNGRKYGQYQTGEYPRAVLGIPPFMINQALRQWRKALLMWLRREPGGLRQAMNGAHATGAVWGRFLRWAKKAKTGIAGRFVL